MSSHRKAELRSLALHRAIAERLSDPGVVERARGQVERWVREGKLHPGWAERWHAELVRPLVELKGRLTEDTQEMIDLRQCTPFVGVLDPRERWRIWRGDEAP
jgi:hypothetical protein